LKPKVDFKLNLTELPDAIISLIIIIIIIIIDNYPVNCSFSATLNLIFVRTRIVMRSLESRIKD
jgi:hypothetical protein